MIKIHSNNKNWKKNIKIFKQNKNINRIKYCYINRIYNRKRINKMQNYNNSMKNKNNKNSNNKNRNNNNNNRKKNNNNQNNNNNNKNKNNININNRNYIRN